MIFTSGCSESATGREHEEKETPSSTRKEEKTPAAAPTKQRAGHTHYHRPPLLLHRVLENGYWQLAYSPTGKACLKQSGRKWQLTQGKKQAAAKRGLGRGLAPQWQYRADVLLPPLIFCPPSKGGAGLSNMAKLGCLRGAPQSEARAWNCSGYCSGSYDFSC